MLKTLLLAGTMIVAAPALAQSTGGTGTTGTMQGGQAGSGTMTAPADSTMTAPADTTGTMSAPADTTATTTAPADSTMSSSSTKPSKSSKSRRSPTSSSPTSQSSAAAPTDTTTARSTTTADPSQPQTADAGAAAQPAAGGVGSVVEQEFATYDKNSDGQLSKVEFSAWMDALKSKQPAGSAAVTDPTYNAKAFAQADTDKSAALSKGELTSFLSGGQVSS